MASRFDHVPTMPRPIRPRAISQDSIALEETICTGLGPGWILARLAEDHSAISAIDTASIKSGNQIRHDEILIGKVIEKF
jgi:hypothetical protein